MGMTNPTTNYWNFRRNLWYALDCPPTIRAGVWAKLTRKVAS